MVGVTDRQFAEYNRAVRNGRCVTKKERISGSHMHRGSIKTTPQIYKASKLRTV